jgi:D-alanyl-D-alanine carboxypeptidase
VLTAAAGSAGPEGGTIEPNSAFRVASLSKTFVAVMLLQLVADGTIGLDDPVVAHAPELTIADGVTIRQLLAHRSGIPEHADGELAPAVLADPAKPWTPRDVVAQRLRTPTHDVRGHDRGMMQPATPFPSGKPGYSKRYLD